MPLNKELQEKLIAVQQDLKAPKGQYNDFGKYNYRSCEDILEAVKPLLHASGLLLILSDEILETGGRIHVKSTASLRHHDGSSIECHGYACEPADKKGMDSSQITGAASSYSRKYALNGLFLIDDNKDADTVGAVGLSDEQLEKIRALVQSTATDEAKFATYIGVPTIEDIPASEFKRAMAALKAKARK